MNLNELREAMTSDATKQHLVFFFREVNILYYGENNTLYFERRLI